MGGEGEEVIGEESTYQVTGGSISFQKGFAGGTTEYFLSSPPVPAAPGILVDWRDPFLCGRTREPVFRTDAAVECQMQAKLEMEFFRHRHGTFAESDFDFETPEPKSKR